MQMQNTNAVYTITRTKTNPNHKTNPTKTLILTVKRRKSEGHNDVTSVW